MSTLQRTATPVKQPRTIALNEVRRYLAGVEALAREARESEDPRVLITGLAVLARQQDTIQRMLLGN
jgi:hypothetical protein